MKYHIFTCQDAGSDTGQALIIIADNHSDDLGVGQLLRDELRKRGRSDLIHKLEAREIETSGP